MIDIDIKCNDGKFKLRTSALIIKDNKILLEKARKGSGYRIPGGHVELGETTNSAIIREIKEELKLDTKIENLYCVLEYLFKDSEDKIYQEINYFYKLKCSNLPLDNFETDEVDKGEEKHHKLYWFDIKEIDKIDLKPKAIIKLLQDNLNDTEKIITINEL